MTSKIQKKEDKATLKLLQEIKALIEESRNCVAIAVNQELTLLYWRVGKCLQEDFVQHRRAEYGQQILPALSAKLTREFGRGWSERNLAYMLRFAEVYPDIEILHTLCANLSWSHFKAVIYLDDPLKRDFYAEMCRMESWSTRTLKTKMDSMLFERTAISRQSDAVIAHELEQLKKNGELSPGLIFKDPYVLDFLELNDRYLEKDLEDAILRELEQFLLELGSGFSFVARQKRIEIDNDDFYIDLLFYNRKLKRLVVIDLKLGSFKAAYKGQMELYLRWLSKYEQEEGEDSPLGLILCSGKKQEQIELLELDQSGIHVAEYYTVLPEKKVLEKKLKEAVTRSRLRLANKGDVE